jgi:ribonuclease P protein component
MLKNINRLRKDHEIRKVFKEGKPIKSKNFTIRWRMNHKGVNRFAVIVGNKIEKRATRRNALKRQMREAIKTLGQSIPQNFDITLGAIHYPSWPLIQKDIVIELAGSFKQISRK